MQVQYVYHCCLCLIFDHCYLLNCTWRQVWLVTTTCRYFLRAEFFFSTSPVPVSCRCRNFKKNCLRPKLFLRPPWLWGLSSACWRHFVSQITNLKTSDHFWLITCRCAVCDTVPLMKNYPRSLKPRPKHFAITSPYWSLCDVVFIFLFSLSM